MHRTPHPSLPSAALALVAMLVLVLVASLAVATGSASAAPGARSVERDPGSPASLRTLRRSAEEARRQRDDAADMLVELELARGRAEDEADRALDVLQLHLVTLYKEGRTARLAQLVAARDVQDVLERADLARQLVDHDRRVVEGWATALEAVERAGRRIGATEQELQRAEARLTRLRGEVEGFDEPARAVDLGTVRTVESDLFFTTGAIPEIGYWGSGLEGASMLASWASSGGAQQAAQVPDGLAGTGEIEVGEASWYGPGFHGRQTANGETYDQYGMTAAHPTLPFGTWVKVVGANGRHVIVRINDRGPFARGRIIDLSWAAAQVLGMDGTMRVQVERFA